MVKNSRLVLLRTGSGSGIMAGPEHLQQPGVGYYSGVKINLQSFGVVPEVAVGGAGGCTTCIADPGARYTFKAPETGVRAPESAKGESGCLQPEACFCIQPVGFNAAVNHACSPSAGVKSSAAEFMQ